eukprot:6484820-Amphidinium_carterae.1
MMRRCATCMESCSKVNSVVLVEKVCELVENSLLAELMEERHAHENYCRGDGAAMTIKTIHKDCFQSTLEDE